MENTTVSINGCVIEVQDRCLLVQDDQTSQEIIVHTDYAPEFYIGDRVGVTYNGIMARSFPPQITAISIDKTGTCMTSPELPTPELPVIEIPTGPNVPNGGWQCQCQCNCYFDPCAGRGNAN